MDVEHTENNKIMLVECLLLEDGLVGWGVGLMLCLFTCKLFSDVRSKSYVTLIGRIVGE